MFKQYYTIDYITDQIVQIKSTNMYTSNLDETI